MKFQYLLPALLLISIPFILLLWLLKTKAVDKPFSSLFLWREAYKNTEAKNPWEKFKNNLLMYVQLITAAVLVLALMSPYIPGHGQPPKLVIVAMDMSGSMNTLADGKQNRFDKAKTAAQKYISSLPKDVPVLLVTLSSAAAIGLPATSDHTAARKYIEELLPENTAFDWTDALEYVDSLRESFGNAQAAIFTDQEASQVPEGVEWFSFFSSGSNGAISSVAHSENGSQTTILVNVVNLSDTLYETDVSLYIDDTFTDVASVSLAARESKDLYFQVPSGTGKVVSARLSQNDALMEDNIGYDLLEPQEKHKVLIVSEKNVFLEKALTAADTALIYKTPDIVEAGRAGETYDTYIFDGNIPESLPEKGNMIFLVPGEKNLENVQVSAVNCDVNQYIYPFEMTAARAAALELPPWASPMFKSGDNIVGFYGYLDGRFIAVLGFDIHDTDFPLLPEFPVFVSNLMDFCSKERLVSQEQCEAGASLELYWPADTKNITIEDPKGNTKVIEDESAAAFFAKYSGLYRLAKKDTEGNEESTFVCASFPVSQESDVSEMTVALGSNDSTEDKEPIFEAGIGLRAAAIILCLCLLLAEWIIYIRRL